MRSSGVLMHISSLPSPYGIGTMGAQAREFVDFLVKAGQQFWQVLPICPTSYGATNQLDNTSRIKEVRKNIARIQTIIAEKARVAE